MTFIDKKDLSQNKRNFADFEIIFYIYVSP